MKALPDYVLEYHCGCRVGFLGRSHFLSAEMECCPKHRRPRYRSRRDAMYLHAYDRMRTAVESVAKSN